MTNHNPGDMIPEYGDILLVDDEIAQCGQVYVTDIQASAAARYGWERVRDTDGLVLIKRNSRVPPT